MENNKITVFHSLMYIFIFGFAVDLIINKIIYCKHKRDNISNHKNSVLCLLVIVLMNKVIFLLFDLDYSKDKIFSMVSYITHGVLCVQVLLGFRLHTNINAFDRLRNIKLIKNIHRINAFIIIVGGKIGVGKLFIYYQNQMDASKFSFFLALFISLNLLIYLYYIMTCRRFGENNYYNIKMKNANVTLSDMKSIIKGEDLGYDASIVSEENQSFSIVRDRSVELFSQYKWVVFEGRIYNLKGFSHPGGNFVLRGVFKQDVTRLIYGADSTVIYNKSTRRYELVGYKHDVRTLNFLDNNFVCVNEHESVFVNRNIEQSFNNSEMSNINLFDSNTDNKSSVNSNYMEDLIQRNWGFDKIEINSQSNFCFLRFSDSNKNDSERTKINLGVYWIKTLGKYYTVTYKKQKHFFYNVLSMTPLYLKMKKDFLQTNFPNIYNLHIRLNLQLEEKLLLTNFQFSQGKLNNLSDDLILLVNNNELRDNSGEVTIEGPFGNDLGFNSTTSQNYIIIMKDEGILPFLDLFEILFQQSLLEKNSTQANWVFGEEYRYCFKNGIGLYFFWDISTDFKETAEILGLLQLQTLYTFQKQHKTNINVIKGFHVKNKELEKTDFESVEFLEEDFYLGINNILDNCSFEPRNVVISGNKAFKTDLMDGMEKTNNSLLNFTVL